MNLGLLADLPNRESPHFVPPHTSLFSPISPLFFFSLFFSLFLPFQIYSLFFSLSSFFTVLSYIPLIFLPPVLSSCCSDLSTMVSPAIRVPPSAAKRAVNLLRTVQYTHPPSCPCHGNPSHHHHHRSPTLSDHVRRHMATPVDPSRQKEYAFEMAASSIRFGPGATKEVGMDFANMRAKRVCIVTDKNVAKLDAMKQAVEGLSREGIEFTVFDKVRVEPKDYSYVSARIMSEGFGLTGKQDQGSDCVCSTV